MKLFPSLLYFSKIWTALASGVLAGAAGVPAQPPTQGPAAPAGTLQVSLRDEKGRPTPARIELLDEQKKGWIAEDALLYGGDAGKATWNLDQALLESPARAMAHFATRKVINSYTKTEQFYANGKFQLSLPPGQYHLRGFKGPEYRIAKKKIEVRPGRTTSLAVTLDRWIDLPAQGWYSSDSHIHIARPYRDLNRTVILQMQAEDIHVTNLLQWGLVSNFHNSTQYAHGLDGVYQEGNYLLIPGQENPRSPVLGHTLIHGTRSLINFPDSYLLYHQFWEEAQQQDALSGWAHFGRVNSRGLEGIALDLLDGLLSIIEVISFDHEDYKVWYDALNLGVRLTPVGGTDYMPPASPYLPGRERFFVRVQGPLTYESWLDGIRRGETFATNGPLLELAVEGKATGEEIKLRGPRSVRVEGAVRFDPELDDVPQLEFVVNGEVVRTFPGDAKQGVIRCRFSHPVTETCWLALRVAGKKRIEGSPYAPRHSFYRDPSPSVAHTAAIHVLVENTPALSAQPRAKAIARKWLGQLVDFENRLRDDQNLPSLARARGASDGMPVEYLRKSRDELLQRIAAAKTRFEALAQ